jgi:hypothetical protein
MTFKPVWRTAGGPWWTIRRFLIPREWIGALQDVPTKDLAKLDIWPDGSAIELEDRDIHISVA